MSHIKLSNREVIEISSQYSEHEKKYSESKSKSDKNSDDVWRVRRFAQEDWILNVRVYRVYKRRKKFQVALFRSADHEKFVEFSGVVGGLIFLLSEAYNQTGKMAVEFVGPVDPNLANLKTGFEPCIPACISSFLAAKNIVVENSNYITDWEARLLYLELTGLESKIITILEARGIDAIQLCFVIQRNIWTLWQAEFLCQYAYAPEKIFLSTIKPEQRAQFMSDMYFMRSLIMVERLQLLIKIKQKLPELPPIKYLSKSSFQIEEKNGNADILVCPFATFIELKNIAQGLKQQDHLKKDTLLLLTADFTNISKFESNWLNSFSKDRQIRIVTILDRTIELDNEIISKLRQSASTTKPPPVKAD